MTVMSALYANCRRRVSDIRNCSNIFFFWSCYQWFYNNKRWMKGVKQWGKKKISFQWQNYRSVEFEQNYEISWTVMIVIWNDCTMRHTTFSLAHWYCENEVKKKKRRAMVWCVIPSIRFDRKTAYQTKLWALR